MQCALKKSQAAETSLVFKGYKCWACTDSKSQRKYKAPARTRTFWHALTSPCTAQAREWVLLLTFGKVKPAIWLWTNHVCAVSLPWWTLLFHSMTGMKWKRCPQSYIFIYLRGWSIPGRGPRNVYPFSKQGEKGQLVSNCRTIHMKMSVYHAALEMSFSFAQICMNKKSFGCCWIWRKNHEF